MRKLIPLILGVAIGITISYFFINNFKTEETMATPKGLITPAEAKALDKAFNSRHQLISDSIVKRPDNRSSWYSLEDMRAYLDLAEAEARAAGYTMNGVRLYLGAHPDNGSTVGYTTMFLVPTGEKNTSEGNMVNMNIQLGKSNDIPGANGLNDGEDGDPPSANYPQ
ncbi:hypothetical protein A9Q87_11625 [Flavobacteriales bacterium 34_180_T64]|nr:hypothetical protein A9Q87_11625 [Flavobacteriales bacterium 34_180_T64]